MCSGKCTEGDCFGSSSSSSPQKTKGCCAGVIIVSEATETSRRHRQSTPVGFGAAGDANRGKERKEREWNVKGTQTVAGEGIHRGSCSCISTSSSQSIRHPKSKTGQRKKERKTEATAAASSASESMPDRQLLEGIPINSIATATAARCSEDAAALSAHTDKSENKTAATALNHTLTGTTISAWP